MIGSVHQLRLALKEYAKKYGLTKTKLTKKLKLNMATLNTFLLGGNSEMATVQKIAEFLEAEEERSRNGTRV